MQVASLEATLTASPLFAPMFVPLALEKLSSTLKCEPLVECRREWTELFHCQLVVAPAIALLAREILSSSPVYARLWG